MLRMKDESMFDIRFISTLLWYCTVSNVFHYFTSAYILQLLPSLFCCHNAWIKVCWVEILKMHKQYPYNSKEQAVGVGLGGIPTGNCLWDVPANTDWQLTGSHLLLPVLCTHYHQLSVPTARKTNPPSPIQVSLSPPDFYACFITYYFNTYLYCILPSCLFLALTLKA